MDIDFFKGLGILSVVIYHTGWQNPVITYIASFHMTLFFFASGFCYRKGKLQSAPEQYCARKAKALLLPYFVFVSLFTVLNYILDIITDSVDSMGDYLSNILYSRLSFGATWYLIALFICVLLSSAIIDRFDRPLALIAVSLGIAALGYLGSVFSVPSVFRWEQGFVGTLFFVLGYLARETLDFSKHGALPTAIGTLVSGLLISAVNGTAILSRMQFGRSFLLFIVSALLSTVGWYCCSYLVTRGETSAFAREIALFGQHSLVVLLTHQVILFVVIHVIKRFLPNKALLAVLSFLIVCVMEHFIVRLYASLKRKS